MRKENRVQKKHFNDIITKKLLQEELIDKEKTVSQLASEIGCSVFPIRKKIKELKLTIKSPRSRQLDRILTKEFLIENHINKNIPYSNIARELKCEQILVRARLKKYGICKYKDLSKLITEEFLLKEYVTNRKIPKELGKIIGCDQNVIIKYLHKFNIPVRNLSEAKKGKLSNSYKGGVTPLHSLIRFSSEMVTWRNGVFQRDHYKCQKCGQVGNHLEAHHIKKFSLLLKEFLRSYPTLTVEKDKITLTRLAATYMPFWDITNGITLCYDCHVLIEKLQSKRYMKKFNHIVKTVLEKIYEGK